jgi:hypothetical protein
VRRPHIPLELRQQVNQDAGHRCGYCRSDELLTGIPLSIEHILPVVLGGTTTRENLWLSCRPCNELKGAQAAASDPETGEIVTLFHPRVHSWTEHFAWSEDGTQVLGLSAVGRATIVALQLNRPMLVSARRRWVLVGCIRPATTIPDARVTLSWIRYGRCGGSGIHLLWRRRG